MTKFVEARDSIVEYLSTNLATDRPALPLFWENTVEVDLDTVGSTFVRIEVEFNDAMQLTINGLPEHETSGLVFFTVFAKQGSGTRSVLELFDYLSDLVKFKRATNFQFTVPRPGRREARGGWASYELVVPFSFNSVE